MAKNIHTEQKLQEAFQQVITESTTKEYEVWDVRHPDKKKTYPATSAYAARQAFFKEAPFNFASTFQTISARLVKGKETPRPMYGEIFTTHHDHADYATAEEAIKAIETRGQGSVVKFILSPNGPGLLPNPVASSVGMWTYNNDGTHRWLGHDIYSGHGRAYGEEKPH